MGTLEIKNNSLDFFGSYPIDTRSFLGEEGVVLEIDYLLKDGRVVTLTTGPVNTRELSIDADKDYATGRFGERLLMVEKRYGVLKILPDKDGHIYTLKTIDK